MQSRDLCYWLQGYFEITSLNGNLENETTLSPKQLRCIQNHLNLVFRVEEYNDSEAFRFCMSLQIDLDLHERNTRSLNVSEIRERLNKVFIHEIDNTVVGDKLELQTIHDGDLIDFYSSTPPQKERETGCVANL